MEVEFLSNIRYNLFVSKEEWEGWHAKLSTFANYLNESTLNPVEDRLGSTISSPTALLSQSAITRAQPPSPLSRLPSPSISGSFDQNWNQPRSGSSYLPPQQYPGDQPTVVNNPRKRYRDEIVDEHPSKKIALTNPLIPPPTSAAVQPPSSVLPPLPAVLTPTTAPSSHVPTIGSVARLPFPSFPPPSSGGVQNAPPAVPQLSTPNGRAIPPVFNNPSPNWIRQIPTSTPAPPVTPGLYNTPANMLDPMTHHRSPYAVPSATVSPVGSAYSVHTPQTHLSPSWILENRNSPYRPVRTVNTLLYPPPSTYLRPLRNVPFDHMQYQPLGKTASESKTGLLPYFNHGAWPQGSYQPILNHNQAYSR